MANEKTVNQAINTMKELNDKAAKLVRKFKASACTDVTGFGLLGHLIEMIEGSKMSAQINIENIPYINGVKNLAIAACIPGGTNNNYEFTASKIKYDNKISEIDKLILNDAQTSGGLLICIDAKHKTKAIEYAKNIGLTYFAEIGTVVEKEDYVLEVLLN